MTSACDADLPDLPPAPCAEDGPPVTPDRLKVLVVDDDEMMHRLVQRALTSFGFTDIFTGMNGAEGVALALRETPDIIICDYHMPEMHGLALVEAVRGDDRLDQTVIIMLSAADEPAVIDGARDLGADTFIVKPFERADLKLMIDTLYQRFNGARIAWPD